VACAAPDHREVITIGTTKTLIAAAAATAGLAGIPTAASAASTPTKPSAGLTNAYDTVYQRVERADGEPGRNIAQDGVRKGGEVRPATRSEVVRSLTTLRRMHAELRPDSEVAQASLRAPTTGSPAPSVSTAGTAPQAAGGSAAPGTAAPATGGGLDSVAQCESGGDPGAVSPDGRYRGKYQFDQQTWNSVGGSGDPAAASEAEQDQRAAALQAQRGSSPWPVCG
jgi:hypothetical protein